ncbi:hypothetical protein KSF78_0009529 [Schistosoma japonicum]|nr:hypothetical protein KSF78_0009529 [Schistosoma japonicum]
MYKSDLKRMELFDENIEKHEVSLFVNLNFYPRCVYKRSLGRRVSKTYLVNPLQFIMHTTNQSRYRNFRGTRSRFVLYFDMLSM